MKSARLYLISNNGSLFLSAKTGWSPKTTLNIDTLVSRVFTELELHVEAVAMKRMVVQNNDRKMRFRRTAFIMNSRRLYQPGLLIMYLLACNSLAGMGIHSSFPFLKGVYELYFLKLGSLFSRAANLAASFPQCNKS